MQKLVHIDMEAIKFVVRVFLFVFRDAMILVYSVIVLLSVYG